MGLYAFFAGLLLLGLLLVWWLVDSGASAAAAFFTDNPIAVIMAWTLPVSVLLAALGFLVMRRAPVRG